PAEDGIRYFHVTGVQTCALPIYLSSLNAIAVAGEPPHDLDEQPSLDVLDALVQSALVVLVPDLHHALRDDRTGVDAVVDEVDGAAGDPDAVRERVPHPVRPREAGQQRG